MTEQKIINRVLNSSTVSESAFRISTYAEDYRIRGYQRVHFYKDEFPSGTSYFVLDPTALAALKKFVFTIPFLVDVPEGPITFSVYEGTDYTGTVDLPYYNPARTSTLSTDVTIKGGASGTDKGTLLYNFSAGEAASAAVVETSGVSQASDPTELDRTKKYLIQVDNPTGGAITANRVYFSWFEVPASDL